MMNEMNELEKEKMLNELLAMKETVDKIMTHVRGLDDVKFYTVICVVLKTYCKENDMDVKELVDCIYAIVNTVNDMDGPY